MKTRIVYPAIIISAFLLNIGLDKLFSEAFLNEDFFFIIESYETYIIISSLTTFFLSIPFYVIVMIVFRKFKDLTFFSSIMVISILAYSIYTILINTTDEWDTTIKIFAGLSYFGSLFGFFVSFGIILQEYYDKIITRSTMIFAVVNYVFASFYTRYSKNFIARIIGDFPPGILEKSFIVYDYIYLGIRAIMVVLSVLIIINLIGKKEAGKKVYTFRQFYE